MAGQPDVGRHQLAEVPTHTGVGASVPDAKAPFEHILSWAPATSQVASVTHALPTVLSSSVVLPGFPPGALELTFLLPLGALLMTGLLGFLQLFPQTLVFGIGFFQFSLFLPQLLTQNFVLLFQFLDSSERRFWVWACHSKLR